MIVATDFRTRPYRIPNEEESKDLQDFIDEKEEEILRLLFGTTLYNAYTAGISVGSPAQKWLNLRDGEDYTYAGITYRYGGLASLLIPCIFAYWVKENTDKFTNVGTIRSTVQNATSVSAARRISEAYGKFLGRAGDECEYCDTLYGFLLANTTDYEDWIFTCPGSMNQFDL